MLPQTRVFNLDNVRPIRALDGSLLQTAPAHSET
jgi:hypothetical protein